MSLRGTLTHRKTRRLAKLLKIDQAYALGILEALTHVAAEQTPAGDVGKIANADLADEMFYDGSPDEMVAALIDAGFLEEHPTYRLVIHDWHQHADDAIQYKLHRAGLLFWNGEPSKRTTDPTEHRLPPGPDETRAPARSKPQPARGQGGKFDGSLSRARPVNDGARPSPPVVLRITEPFDDSVQSGSRPDGDRKRPTATVADGPTERNLTEQNRTAGSARAQTSAPKPPSAPSIPPLPTGDDDAVYAAAYQAIEQWCESPPTTGGLGRPFQLSQFDQQYLSEWYENLVPPRSPPVVRGGAQIGKHLLIPEVVASLMAKRRPFKGTKYALISLGSTLDEWAAAGAPEERQAARAPSFDELDRQESAEKANRVAAKLAKQRETA